MAGIGTLQLGICSLGCKNPVWVKSCFEELVVHVCGYYKIILVFNEIKQFSIKAGCRHVHIVHADMTSPVGPFLLLAFEGIES